MDVAAMRDSGNLAVAEAEIRIACLLSGLVERGRCEHFVRVHQFLRCAAAPPPAWGTPDNRRPAGSLSRFLAAPRPPAVRTAGKRRGRAVDLQYIRCAAAVPRDRPPSGRAALAALAPAARHGRACEQSNLSARVLCSPARADLW